MDYLIKRDAGLLPEDSQDSSLWRSSASCSSAIDFNEVLEMDGPSTPADTPSLSPPTPVPSSCKASPGLVVKEGSLSPSAESEILVKDSQQTSSQVNSTADSCKEPCVIQDSQDLRLPPPKNPSHVFSSFCRKGKNIYLLLPVNHYPACCEKGCGHTFVTDRLNNLCSAIDLHFREVHHLKSTSIRKLCDSCDDEIQKDPRHHSCFTAKSYYDIDYNAYSFQHKCKSCMFSTPEEKWLKRHKCRYALKKKSPPRPLQEGFDLSPVANLSENSPVAQPVSAATVCLQASFTQENLSNEANCASSPTLRSRDTQALSPPPGLSFVNAAVSPRHAADMPISQLRSPVQPQVHSENVAVNSESGLPSSTSYADVVRSPPTLSISVQNTSLYPGSICRLAGELHIVLPMDNFFRCTEPGCSKTIYSGNFSSAKGSFLKHLSNKHKRIGLTVVTWCSFCKKQVKEIKLSSHACLSDSRYYNVDFSILPFENKCHLCPFNTDTSTGLKNHLSHHRRKQARTQKRMKNSCSSSKPIDNTATPPSSDHSESPSPSSSPPASVLLSPGSELISDSMRSQVVVPPDTDLLSMPGSPQRAPVPTGDGIERVIQELEETPNPDDPSPSADFLKKFKSILISDSVNEWEAFTSLLDDYIRFAQKRVKLPEDKESRTFRKPNPRNKTFIQRLYKRNRRRAVRLILGQAQGNCDLDPEELAEHFFPLSDFCPDLSILDPISAVDNEIDLSKFSPEEVWVKLSKAENTAPGPDRLTFHHWKSTDPEAKTLACIFNICLKYHLIPESWKTSRTVFIPKNESGESFSDWRPISLCSTISKLFSSCLTKRVVNWIMENNVISPAQKGFMPYDGAFENNFVLQKKINDARCQNGNICLASIDISNAFGNVPHDLIKSMITRTGAGQTFHDLVSALIDEATTSISTSTGSSTSRRISRGVRQGDPISGILFNLAVEPLIRSVDCLTEKLNILAFADDIILFADSPEELQVYLYELSVTCSKLGLSINPNKCFSMHLSNSPRECLPTEFKVGEDTIPHLLDFDEKKFLGKPIGFQVVKDSSDLNAFRESALSLLDSSLAYWQKIDALKAFVFPSFAFAQRTGQANKTDWCNLDKDIRHGIKEALCVPSRAANEYLYGNQKDGLFGIPLAGEDSDIAYIDGAFKLLSSKDPHTRNLAWDDFRKVVSFTMPPPCSNHHFSAYLSNEPLHRASNMPSSIWSRARKASGNLKVVWEFQEDLSFSISYGDSTITDRTKVFHTLRSLFKSERTQALIQKPHQGKTASCFRKAKASSHFNHNGKFIRFTDWRFIHRARLGLVDLNGYKREASESEKQCRRCNGDKDGPRAETLPHVLNNCKCNMKKITERHNEIIGHVKKAALGRSWNVYSENRAIAGSKLRPDLVLTKDKSAIIIDAAVTFENGESAFDRARKIKLEKYANIAKELRNSYSDVSIAPIIVGSLGSWDPKNDRHLLRLCSKKYLNLMRKIIVSDTVRYSRDIFIEHTWGIKQCQPSKYYPRPRPEEISRPAPLDLSPVASHTPSGEPTVISQSVPICSAYPPKDFSELSCPSLPESQNPALVRVLRSSSELSLTSLPESQNEAIRELSYNLTESQPKKMG